MGQYYIIANVDKKESFFNKCGVKLMEFSWCGNDGMNALLGLLTGPWKDDRVYVVGDYASVADSKSCNYHEALKEVYNEVSSEENMTDNSLYAIACGWEKEFNWGPFAEAGKKVRFVYNKELRQYVDLQHLLIDHVHVGRDTVDVARVFPISLLLAMGNGLGGGDYNGRHQYHVGSWCKTSAGVFASETEIPDHDKYAEFFPNFAESDHAYAWEDAGEAIVDAIRESGAKRVSAPQK